MITILGAGLIGSSVAWRLAQQGAGVTLIDAGKFGGETSSAGAGMLSPGGEFEEPSRWLDLGIEGMKMYPAFIDELRAESGLPVDFQLCGSIYYVDRSKAEKRAEFQRAEGIRVELREGGLTYPDDGFVDPVQILSALRRACEGRGVSILENEPVPSIDPSQHDAIVIAAGAWSDQIRVSGIALPPVKPIKGHLIGFDLPPGTLGPMRRRGHTYVLQRSNGFTIAGSNEQDLGFDRSVDQKICDELHRHAAELFPRLVDMVPSKQWVGLRPFSPDGPHIGPVDGTNVWLAYGHFRNGILLAPLTAQRIAEQIKNGGS